jgi:hypothetical protein
MFKDEVISLETAKLAKEKQFRVGVKGEYTEYHTTQIDEEYPEGGGPFSMTKGEVTYDDSFFINDEKMCDISNEHYTIYAAPTQSLLAKWLRDVHDIQVYAYSHTIRNANPKMGTAKYKDYVAHVNEKEINDARDEEYQTYEAALEAGLKYALNTLKHA